MKPSPEVRMALNAQRWLAEAGFPPVAILADPAPRADHCYMSCSDAALAHARDVMDGWSYMIRVKDHSPLGYPTAKTGWRERRGRWAAQLIHHHDPVHRADFLELDFDWHNPDWDGISAILHGICDWCAQKIRKTKTDPFTVAKKRKWLVEEV